MGRGCWNRPTFHVLQYELSVRKLRFATQRLLPITYKGIVLDASYRLDFVVEDMVIVEVKSVAALLPVHDAQLLTYLNLGGQPAGLLINFNVPRLVSGVKRLLNRNVLSSRRATEDTG